MTASVIPEYESIATVVRIYTFIPRADVEVTEPLALNLDEDIVALHAKLQEEIDSDQQFIRAEVSKEMSILLARTIEGNLSFLDLLTAGGGLSTRNVHKVRINFCLENEFGGCVGN